MENYQNESPPVLFAQALAEFNQQQFFEAHETLEILWNNEKRELRLFYQAILQIGVGFYKVKTKPNYRGAISLLTTGIELLRPFAPYQFKVDVAKLLAEAEQALLELKQLGHEGFTEFVSIPSIDVIE